MRSFPRISTTVRSIPAGSFRAREVEFLPCEDRLSGPAECWLSLARSLRAATVRVRLGSCACSTASRAYQFPFRRHFDSPVQAAIRSILEHGARLEHTNICFHFVRQGQDLLVILRRWLPEEDAICGGPSVPGGSTPQEMSGAAVDAYVSKHLRDIRRGLWNATLI